MSGGKPLFLTCSLPKFGGELDPINMNRSGRGASPADYCLTVFVFRLYPQDES